MVSPTFPVDSSLGSFFAVLPALASVPHLVRKYFWLDPLHDHLLHLFYAGFVAFIKRPLLDPLGPHEPGSQQDLHVFAGRRLAHAEFFSNRHSAYAVLDEIAIHLRPEMPPRALQPFQDLQPAVVRQGPQNNFCLHIDN